MNFDYIFVVTYGRSGSTLLQGILNAIPGVCIRGENGSALRGLLSSVRALAGANVSFGSEEAGVSTSPWYGINEVDIDAYVTALRRAFVDNVLRPGPASIACGFKEIRYHIGDVVALNDELELMRRIFPRSAFLLNVRNIEDVLRSTELAAHGVEPAEIRQTDEALRAYAAEGREDTILVDYDQYQSDPGKLKSLFEFLGSPLDPITLQQVMSTTHSSILTRKC